jgi:hypothetical protein
MQAANVEVPWLADAQFWVDVFLHDWHALLCFRAIPQVTPLVAAWRTG